MSILSSEDLIEAIKHKAAQEDALVETKRDILNYIVQENITEFFSVNWDALKRVARVPRRGTK